MDQMERELGLKPKVLNYYDDPEEEQNIDFDKDVDLFMLSF